MNGLRLRTPADSAAALAAENAARRDRIDEDRAVLAGLIALLREAKHSRRYVQELGLLVSVAEDGETEIARAHRALATIQRVADKLSPLVPNRGIVAVRETVDHLQLQLTLAAQTEGL